MSQTGMSQRPLRCFISVAGYDAQLGTGITKKGVSKTMSTKAERKAQRRAENVRTQAPAASITEAVENALAEAAETKSPERPKAVFYPPAEEAPVVAEAEAPEETPEAEAKVETPEAQPEAEAELPAEDQAILDAIKALPDGEAKEKALLRFGKLKAQDDKSSQAKRFVEFDGAVKTQLPTWLGELAKKHNVSLVGRKITIAYPSDGSEAKHSHTPVGSRGGGNGNRTGFTSHGEVEYEGKKHNSLHALADVDLPSKPPLQYEGRRNAFQVFTEPLSKGEKKELPYKFSVTKQDNGTLLVEKHDKK